MGGKVDVYNLTRGVVVDKSAVHEEDGELLEAQNWQVDAVGGLGSVRRRDGLAALNAAPLGGPVLGAIGVPLPDRALYQRVLYLALNRGPYTFKLSLDGVTWTDATLPAPPVHEATLGLEGGFPFGDAAMQWRGFNDVLYYPGNDYSPTGPSLPSIHAWDGQTDVVIARIPINASVTPGTAGAWGVTSLLPWSPTQLLVTVADRNVTPGTGRMRVLLLDVRNGSLTEIGPDTDLIHGHAIAGLVEWQGRVWTAGVNAPAGGPLQTFWTRPGDPTWTLDDSFSTTHGYCTGLVEFKGNLYQGSAADAGANGLIRRRGHSTVLGGLSTVAGGSTTVAGGSTVVDGGSTIVRAGDSTVPVVLGPQTQLDVRNTNVLHAYAAHTTTIDVVDISVFSTFGGGAECSSPGGGLLDFSYTGTSGTSGNGTLTGVSWPGGPGLPFSLPATTYIQNVVYFGPTMAVADMTGFPASGAFSVSLTTGGAYVMTYTGRTASSGRGEFTGVTGGPGPSTFTIYQLLVKPLIGPGSTSIPVVDLIWFASAGGKALADGQVITYTGVTASSGPGSLTGVSGITAAIAAGSFVVGIVPIGAASVPVDNTAGFVLVPGSAVLGGYPITYTGRSTSSGPGTLTGVTGVVAAIPSGSTVAPVIPIGATSLPIADTSVFVLAAGAAIVNGQAITYTGRSGSSGSGVLTGVTGIAVAVPSGAPVAPVIPSGSTSLPIVDTAIFFLAAGAALVAGMTIAYTGRSASSGPGVLTGVTGIATAIGIGAAVAVVVPIGATSIPVVDTAPFNAGGGVLSIGGVLINYGGRSTTSGPGVLTGVTGVTALIVGGASIVPNVTAGVWAIVHTSDGTGAGNYCGPLIVTADGGTVFAFRNSVSGGAAPNVRILQSVDGLTWSTAYNISDALSDAYGRSGMPIRDDNGDLYWPLASGAAQAPGGLVRRTALGVWSVVLRDVPSIRGPIGIVRARDAVNTGLSALSYAITIETDEPIGYWRLGELSGAVAADSSGHGFDGAIIGGVTLNQPGAVSGNLAMAFDGVVGSRIAVPPNVAFEMTAAVAVEAWVKTATAVQFGGILEKTIGGVVNTSYSLFQNGGVWTFRVCTQPAPGHPFGGPFGPIDTSWPVQPDDVGEWVHFVGVLAYGNTALFRNGVFVAGATAGGIIGAGSGVVTIGHLGTDALHLGGALPFAGSIDEVAIYPLLTGTQVATHYSRR